MKLTEVIESLVEERGLDREKVISIICEGMLAAYKKKYPDQEFTVSFNRKLGDAEVFVMKEVVSGVEDDNLQISLRRARGVKPSAGLGEVVAVPFENKIGRIEILAAKQIIAQKIRELEHAAVLKEFKDQEGSIISGSAHKKDRSGVIVKIADTMALLPNSNSIPGEVVKIGLPVRALLKEVLAAPRGDFQLILDRSSAEFVKKLLEIEIPEIFEKIVEITKIVRIPGYKTKVVVLSHSPEVDPVGTCVGVDGVRIKPILRELSGEKIDLIEHTESLESLVKHSLKPAEIDKVEVSGDTATVWLSTDQRSIAIGKMGRNIALASRLTGVNINLQEEVPAPALFGESLQEESSDESSDEAMGDQELSDN